MLDRRGWPGEVNSLLDISGLSQIFKLAIRLHLLHLGGGRTYEPLVMLDRRGWPEEVNASMQGLYIFELSQIFKPVF